MIKLLFITITTLVLTSQKNCNNTSRRENCYKGRLEIKGICSNYTIKVIEGNLDSSRIAANWTDENTGKSYTNVFALDSPCSFPADIQQGDEFYFTIKAEKDKDCNVCMAYYPVPPKRLSISASKTACP